MYHSRAKGSQLSYAWPWRADFIHVGMTLSLRREAALDEIVVAAALLFTNGQTTERTFVTAERLGRAE